MVAAALVAVVLWQKSEGGALGIGGGGGGGFLTGRGTANLLTRTTAILAACFFLTSILLTLISQHSAPKGSAFDAPASTMVPADPGAPAAPAAPGAAPAADAPRGGILDKIK
jgi:preprotein translocase subunit SecG